ncbi:hypothetical protein NDU88_006009 [Pleurodeles waltl]|uniref:Uncharacterized protein n=1 Tax=Pleurodeles waltl TaxID=8319 RepID=A0AAV7SNF0_PLEWA|nr:hypothetical protein NDU88_006009 [Pleurodeles waltl]
MCRSRLLSRTGPKHIYIGDEAGNLISRVALPSPHVVTGIEDRHCAEGSEEPDSAEEKKKNRENKEEGRRALPHGEPCIRPGERPAVICVAAGPTGVLHLARASPTAAHEKERRGQRSIERASGKTVRHVGKRRREQRSHTPLKRTSRVCSGSARAVLPRKGEHSV